MDLRSRLATSSLVAVVLCLMAAGDASASSQQRVLVDAPHGLLSGDAAVRDDTLTRITDLGADEVRIVLYWDRVAPDADNANVPGFNERDPAAYDWGAYATAVEAARARGLAVLLTVSGPVPRWATATRRDHRTRPSPERFARFMQAVGLRFGPEVSAFSIWNEPNHPRFLLPQKTKYDHAESGRIYRKLYQAAVAGLRRGGAAGVRVLMGETAPRGTSSTVAPLAFLRRTLCLTNAYRRDTHRGCHELVTDGYAHHPYTTRAGPRFRPPNRDDVTIGVLSRLNSALAAAERNGLLSRDTGIYITEFGIQSKPDLVSGVSFTAQAEQRSLSELLAYANPRVRVFAQYLLRDDLPREGPAASRYSGFETGLLTSGGNEKLSYEAFRLPLVARRASAHRTALWGLVRPAARRVTVSIDIRSRHGDWHYLKHDQTDSRGYWRTATTFVSDRRYRVRWRDAAGVQHTGPLTRMSR